MSRKKVIMIGMVIGSFAGGYAVSWLFGADGISFASIIGSGLGAMLGIYFAHRMTA